VTDRRAPSGRDLVDVVSAALDAGLPAVQLREKDLPGRPLLALAERLRRVTADRGASLFVNDRLDVALAVDADGVQLGERSFSTSVARESLPGRLVGASVHDVDAAAASEADFVVFGPVFATPSKAAFGPPHGLPVLAAAARAARVPVVAIGGIEPSRVAAVRAAGAHGVAVVRAILAAADPAAATKDLLAQRI
jgi:thiamine-phosphate pyrophosphorylase